MPKKPYIPLYIGDWDRVTNLLSPLAEFALLKLTIKMFDAKIKGVFHADFSTLCILFKSDLGVTKEILKELIKKEILDIEEIKDDGFCIKSRRMLKQTSISEMRSALGKKGGKAKRKQNGSKPKVNSEAKGKQNADIDIDIENDNNPSIELCIEAKFSKIFDRWLNYKKARKETYKTDESKQLALKKLIRLSDGKTEKATEIIEEAMSNNWGGFFELKNGHTYPSAPTEQPEPTDKPKMVY